MKNKYFNIMLKILVSIAMVLTLMPSLIHDASAATSFQDEVYGFNVKIKDVKMRESGEEYKDLPSNYSLSYCDISKIDGKEYQVTYTLALLAEILGVSGSSTIWASDQTVTFSDVTCTNDFYKSFNKTYVGKYMNKNIEYQYTVEVTRQGSLGHSYKIWNDNDDGRHYSVCDINSEHIEYESHNWIDATCVTVKTCHVCNLTEGDVDVNAHDWNDSISHNNGTHTHVCKLNNEHVETVECTYSDATCLNLPTCIYCGYENGVVNENNHTKTTYVYKANNESLHNIVHECCEKVSSNESHTFDKNGYCSLCKYQCEHSEFKNSVCQNCNFVCLHSQMINGECSVCHIKGKFPYIHREWNKETNTLDQKILFAPADATVVTSDLTEFAEGWYIVTEDITFESRISSSGNVHLILSDNTTLTFKGSLSIWDGIFTIYSQSDSKSTMGKLNSNAYDVDCAGIYVDAEATLIINGGNIYARGGTISTLVSYGAGIGAQWKGWKSGPIVINGGYVNAIGDSNSAGIGNVAETNGGSVTINGGTVKAQGCDGSAGIGSGRYGKGLTVVINGGNINALSSKSQSGYSDAIGGGVGRTGTGTIRNSNNTNLTLKTITIESVGFETEMASISLDSGTYNLNNVYTLDENKLYLYLPSETVVNSLTTVEGHGFEPREATDTTFYCVHNIIVDGFCDYCGYCTTPKEPKMEKGFYLISDVYELAWFANAVNSGNTILDAKLVNNIDATSMKNKYIGLAGTNSYKGEFDGNFKTITINREEKEAKGLFGYVEEATIKNLKVDGTIRTAGTCATGIVSHIGAGTTYIDRCISDADITSLYSGAGYHGGIVGECQEHGMLYMTNCGFIGSIYGEYTTSCGGLAGNSYGSIRISDSYVAGDVKLQSTNNTNIFARGNDVSVESGYYLNAYGGRPKATEKKTAEEFANGTVTYLLNKGVTDGTQAWYQTIGTDEFPNFTGNTVYYDEGNNTYYNHVHEFTYEMIDNVIHATCIAQGCDNPNGTISLTVPQDLTYNASAKQVTIISTDNLKTITDTLTVSYQDKNGNTANECINAGQYSAYLTVDNKTISVSFEIEKIDPVLGNVYSEGEYSYTASPSTVTVLKDDNTVPGTFTITDEELTYNVSEYNYEFIPEDSDNYNTVTGMVEVNVIDNVAPVPYTYITDIKSTELEIVVVGADIDDIESYSLLVEEDGEQNNITETHLGEGIFKITGLEPNTKYLCKYEVSDKSGNIGTGECYIKTAYEILYLEDITPNPGLELITQFWSEGYFAFIDWFGKVNADFNTVYSCEGIIYPKKDNYFYEGTKISGYENVSCDINGVLHFSHTFEKTRLQKIWQVNPIDTVQLSAHLTGALAAIAHLPEYTDVTFEYGSRIQLPVEYEFAGTEWNIAPNGENTFTYQVIVPEHIDVNGKSLTGSVSVINADALPVTITGEDAEITYDGSTVDLSQLFDIDSNAGEAHYTVIPQFDTDKEYAVIEGSSCNFKMAGVYTVRVGTEANGIYASATASATLTVNKAEGFAAVTVEDYIYGEEPSEIEIITDTHKDSQYSYVVESVYDSESYYENQLPTKAGHYDMTITIEGNDCYNSVISHVQFEVQKREITISDITVKDKYYDGTADAEVLNVVTDNIVTGDDISVNVTGLKYPSSHADSDMSIEVSLDNISITGNDADNYKLVSYPQTLTGNINPRPVTIVPEADQSKVYGNEDPVFAYGFEEGKGLISGDTLEGHLGREAGEDAGTYKYVISTLSHPDYDITVAEDFFVIEKAHLTITAEDKDAHYGQQRPQFTYTVEGLQYDDKVVTEPEYECEATATLMKTGTYEIRPYNAVVNDNYEITYIPGTLTVERTWDATEGVEYALSHHEWTNEFVVITANDGYRISRREDYIGLDIINLGALQEGVNEVTIYVQELATGKISLPETVIYKIDTSNPEVTVEVGENRWNTLLNDITFGLFFNETQEIRVSASDAYSGVKSIEYYESAAPLTAEQLETAEWKEMKDGKASVTLEDAKQFIYYIKVKDNAGNISYISTDGAEYDTTAPIITGIEDQSTYYVTQEFEVSDKNPDKVYINDEETQDYTLKGNIEETYEIRVTDKAGNEITYTVHMLPITSITDAMKDMNEDNIKSSDTDTVNAVKDELESIDVSNATDEEKQEIQSGIQKTEDLIKAVEETAEDVKDVKDNVNAYDEDKVTSENKEDIKDLIERLEALLEGENLTDDEKEVLEQIKDNAEKLVEQIEATEEEIKDVTDNVNGYDEDKVTSDDKDDIQSLIERIETLLEDDNVTETEKEALETVKDNAESLVDIIEVIEQEIVDVTDQVNGYDEETVKTTDKEAIQSLIERIEDLLEDDNVTETEKEALQTVKDNAEDLVNIIEATEEEIKDVTDNVNGYDKETVKSTDKETIQSLIERIDSLLEDDNVTDEEKEALQTVKDNAENLVDIIETTEEEIKDVTDLVNGYDKETVTSDDKEAVQSLIERIEDLLEDDNVTDEEKESLQTVKDNAENLVDIIEAIEQEIVDVTDSVNGYDEDSVKSTDKETIQSLIERIDSLLEDDNVTKEEKESLQTVKDNAENLVDIIEAIEQEIVDVTDSVNGYDKETVKSTDKEAIQSLIERIETLLEDDNVTDGEKESLQTVKDNAESLVDIIEAIEQEIVDITDLVNGYEEETVKTADKEAIQSLIERIEDLLEDDNVTEKEKEALQTVKDNAENLVDIIEATEEEIKDVTEQVNGYDEDKVTSDDKDDIQSLIERIETLLEDDKVTEEEKEALETVKDNAEKHINVIETTEKEVQNLIDKINGYDKDKLVSKDKEDIEALIEKLEALLKDDNVTDEQKALLETLKDNAEEYITIIEDIIENEKVETYDLLPNMKSMMFLLVCALVGIVVSRKRKEEN